MNPASLRSQRISATESSQIGEARRAASAMGRHLGLNEEDTGRIGIIATEMATNLIRHAREGQLILRELFESDGRGVELLAIDKGPGMDNIEKCLRDGYSTAGTQGTGLGSIRRLSNLFDIYSQPNVGTALVSRIWSGKSNPTHALEIGAVCLPLEGESACGDIWFSRKDDEKTHRILLADGLGHGAEAAHAANEAVRIFQQHPHLNASDLFEAVHRALRSTRGAGMALIQIDIASQMVRFAGVGNISGSILNEGASRSMVSHNGTLGLMVPRFKSFDYPWHKNAVLIACTDGLKTRWDIKTYPGLIMRHPSLIAGILYRDFQRERDDTTVIVVKERL